MRKLTLSALVLLLVATAASAAPATPAANNQALSLPISGTFPDAAGGTGVFSGTFKLIEFAPVNNALVARGYVMGTLTDSLGHPIGTVAKAVELPATVSRGTSALRQDGRIAVRSNATCDILNLDLGPLHLDLLGLTVDLNQVVLDIAAQTGSGNLLGNLLCAVVSLLDGAGSLVDISQLLNRILEILTGILG